MALYDGFFDAVVEESTGKYDRSYESGDFAGYFANVIGSGVCIHDNQNSFKAEYEDGTLYLRPGYLFIRGYWLANKAGEGESNYKGYTVTLPADMTGSMAVVAHLNLGKRLIEIEVSSVSQAYPDALVLAIITAATAEDTRHNTDICGVIDTAGALSSKVEWAVNYIDNEIESKLAAVERDIAAQSAKLDVKIAEVQAVADSIVPPPIGSIKFSASQDVGEEWLQCDGSFINEAGYPELVAALGKLAPSGDKFQLISSGEIGSQISNGVLYGGRMWVYSYSTQKLYGIDVEGEEAVKEIAVTSEDENFNNFIPPTSTSPIALSIVPHASGGARLFLAQIISDGEISEYPAMAEHFLMFQSEFLESKSTISVAYTFQAIQHTYYGGDNRDVRYAYAFLSDSIPTVTAKSVSGVETYFFSCGQKAVNTRTSVAAISYFKYGYVSWSDDGGAKINSPREKLPGERTNFGEKSKQELTIVGYQSGGTVYVESYPSGVFSGSISDTGSNAPKTRATPVPVNVVGADKILFAFDKNLFPWTSVVDGKVKSIDPGVVLPSAARVFPDAAAYLWGKAVYMVFVGTGIIFSRTLEEGSFGYLDTTSVLGTITQFGYLDYSQNEGTLYILGQDTANTVKVAKIVLNTLYDYANDGAWLPMIASDGVPAYIKAKEGA